MEGDDAEQDPGAHPGPDRGGDEARRGDLQGAAGRGRARAADRGRPASAPTTTSSMPISRISATTTRSPDPHGPERMALPACGGAICRLKGTAPDGETRLLRRSGRRARAPPRPTSRRPTARKAMEHHPDRNQHNPEAEAQLQGGQRGLRRPEGRPEEGGLRPLRPCGLRERQAAARGFRGGRARATSPRPSRTCSTTSSAISWAARGGGAAASARRAARTCATTCADARGGLSAASRRRSPCRLERRLRGLQRHRRRGRRRARRPARPARAWARCAPSRASSPSSAPARPAAGRGQIIKNPCKACAGAGRVRQGPHAQRQHPRRASRPAPASGWPARARPGCAAGRRAISTSSSRSSDAPDLRARQPEPLLPHPGLMTTAALGGEIEAPTLDGGTTPGQGARGRAVGQAAAPARQGHAGAARRRRRATSTSSSRSRPRST